MFELGAVVRSRASGRIGVVTKVLSGGRAGRAIYVAWNGTGDSSLMGPQELEFYSGARSVAEPTLWSDEPATLPDG